LQHRILRLIDRTSADKKTVSGETDTADPGLSIMWPMGHVTCNAGPLPFAGINRIRF